MPLASRALPLIVTAFALVVCTPASIDSARWWRSPRIAPILQLSAQQAHSIDAIYYGALPEQRACRRAADAARVRLDRMLATDAAETEIERALAEVANADAASHRARTLMLVRMYRVLTIEQRIRLDNLAKSRRRMSQDARR